MTKRLQPDDIPYPGQRVDDLRLAPRHDPAPLPLNYPHRGIARSEAFLIEQGQMNGPDVIRARLDTWATEQTLPRPTVALPPRLPARAPIRRDRDVRAQSVVCIVSVVMTVGIWAGLGWMVARALTQQ